MFLIPILTLLIIIWFVFQLFHQTQSYHSQQNNSCNNSGYGKDRSLEILRERYARGEITDEEYHKIKRNLES